MPRKRSQAEIQADVEIHRGSQRVELILGIVRAVTPWAGAVAFGYMLYLTAQVLAGQTTVANFGLKVLADVRISDAVAWMFGASGVSYGVSQRRLRKKDNERLTTRNEALERRIDPKRSTSGLTRSGDTPPQERI